MSSFQESRSSAESTFSSYASTTRRSRNRILTYNTVRQKFAYIPQAELQEYPKTQVQEVGVGRFRNGVTVALTGGKGVRVKAKIHFPPDIVAARLIGRWKELYVIKGVEGMKWRYG